MLHSFSATGSDGANPYAGLIADAAGNLYGTTAFGGAGTNCAARLRHGVRAETDRDPDRAPQLRRQRRGTTLRRPDRRRGGQPLRHDRSGGASTNCGASGCGTVFELTPTGTLTVLHSFTFQRRGGSLCRPDRRRGGQPLRHDRSGGVRRWRHGVRADADRDPDRAPRLHRRRARGISQARPLIADAAGNLYGTTSRGGASSQLQRLRLRHRVQADADRDPDRAPQLRRQRRRNSPAPA